MYADFTTKQYHMIASENFRAADIQQVLTDEHQYQ
jgi:hypothetical protein